MTRWHTWWPMAGQPQRDYTISGRSLADFMFIRIIQIPFNSKVISCHNILPKSFHSMLVIPTPNSIKCHSEVITKSSQIKPMSRNIKKY